jgi:hypothetical protein
MRTALTASLALLALAVPAVAQCNNGFSGGGLPIPDPGMRTFDLSCGGAFGTVRSVQLSLRIAHGRQGDLIIRLRHQASGQVATLMNRPGTEDGQSTTGYTAANLGTQGLFVFDDAAPGPYAVPPVGAYPRPGVDGIGGAFKPTVDPLSVFFGLPIDSVWTVEVSDASPGFAGAVSALGIQVEQIEPLTCYPNCDRSTSPPFLNINDFICFQSFFAMGQPYANCDNSTTPPILNVNDFICFLSSFAAGCSAP